MGKKRKDDGEKDELECLQTLGLTRKQAQRTVAADEKAAAKTGRPRTPLKVDADQVEALAALGLTRPEIAEIAGVSRITLWKRIKESPSFLNAMKKGRARLTSSIRRALYDEAVNKRNVTALIWISKNELGWADKHEHSGPGQGPMKVKHNHGLSDERAATIKKMIFGINE